MQPKPNFETCNYSKTTEEEEETITHTSRHEAAQMNPQEIEQQEKFQHKPQDPEFRVSLAESEPPDAQPSSDDILKLLLAVFSGFVIVIFRAYL